MVRTVQGQRAWLTISLGILLLSGLATADPASEPEGPSAAAAAIAIDRDLQPIVLTGAQLPGLAVVANYVEAPPSPGCGKYVPQAGADASSCPIKGAEEQQDGVHVPLAAVPGQESGTPTDQIAAFAWDGRAFKAIAVQVDERFQRYLTNYDSNFGSYSQADPEWTYAFDVDGRMKETRGPGARACEDPSDASGMTAGLCDPASPAWPDPVPGLDSDDEVVFMHRDAGLRAPLGKAPPASNVVELRIIDPLDPAATPTYVYLGRQDAPMVFAPLVTYERDADADQFVKANRGTYGGAQGGGPCWNYDGLDAQSTPGLSNDARQEPPAILESCAGRRPRDSATVTGETYQFHYAGRWKMDEIRLRDAAGGWGPDLVDRWKGRAFQLREDVGMGSSIAFEDETYWTLSSITMGERTGPIRVLRETWGADSGTHVTRLETFYANHFEQLYHMRVHPIPPDGIYAFWDHNADAVHTYYSSVATAGVPIDGVNDEVLMCSDDPADPRSELPAGMGATFVADPTCPGDNGLFLVDLPDPSVQLPLSNLVWDQVVGASGSMATTIEAVQTAQAGVLTTYYRDDATFDDGTGDDPSPDLQKTGCDPADTTCQGSFGAHGVHFFFTADTDNTFVPAPNSEFIARTSQYLLPGIQENRGAAIAQLDFARPLVHAEAVPAVTRQTIDPNWARDGSFEGADGDGYVTYYRARQDADHAATGLRSIRVLDVEPIDRPEGTPATYRPYGLAVALVKPGLTLGDLQGVSYRYHYPDKTTTWAPSGNHYIAFDADGDGLSDGCISASSTVLDSGPGWVDLAWDTSSTYRGSNWRNCNAEGDTSVMAGFDALPATAPLSTYQTAYPELPVRSVTVQIAGSNGHVGASPDPLFVDDLQVKGIRDATCADHADGTANCISPGISARIEPRKALRTDGFAIVEADVANQFLFDITAEEPFADWRLEVRDPAGDVRFAVGNCGAVDAPRSASTGATLVVGVPAASLLQGTVADRLVTIVFVVCSEGIEHATMYGEASADAQALGGTELAAASEVIPTLVRLEARRMNPLGQGDFTLSGLPIP